MAGLTLKLIIDGSKMALIRIIFYWFYNILSAAIWLALIRNETACLIRRYQDTRDSTYIVSFFIMEIKSSDFYIKYVQPLHVNY